MTENGCFGAKKGRVGRVNFNLYHYAGNNPVKYTDPDGREIYIDGDDAYRTAVLDSIKKLAPNAKFDEKRAGYIILGDGHTPKGCETGTALIKKLVENPNKVTISQNKNSNADFWSSMSKVKGNSCIPGNAELMRNGIACNAHVQFNLKNETLDNGFGQKDWKPDLCFSLAHELIHAMHIFQGNRHPSLEQEEIRTCQETNAIIGEMRGAGLTTTQNRMGYNFNGRYLRIPQ
ncbi:MAG: hypothetical protein J5965_07050 [Aeriscardovia sp.]|nr:hypothetical protein [Aeriscardovia sp.]MBP3283563.1 hypothetical protein [Treponema sp.]